MVLPLRALALFPLLGIGACATHAPLPPPAPQPPHATAAPAPGGYDPRLPAAPPAPAALPSPVVVPLDAASRARIPREAVTAQAHGQALQCEGIDLAALLRAAGAMPAEPLRGPQLSRYVQVDGRDGYRALFALAELDPTLGHGRVFLVDRCGGKPLDDRDGPLRLLAPDAARPARWVRQVKSIVVVVAP